MDEQPVQFGRLQFDKNGRPETRRFHEMIVVDRRGWENHVENLPHDIILKSLKGKKGAHNVMKVFEGGGQPLHSTQRTTKGSWPDPFAFFFVMMCIYCLFTGVLIMRAIIDGIMTALQF